MEEIKGIIKSKNTNENVFSQSHKSVQFNQINSTKIIPHLLNLKYKIGGTSENNKEDVNTNIPKASSKIISRNINKMPILHSYSIRPPDYLSKFMKKKIKGINNEIDAEEGFKMNDSSNLNYGKTENFSSNKINNNISSLIKNSMTPQSKVSPKRMNSINVNYFNKNTLKNNLNNQRNNDDSIQRSSFNSKNNELKKFGLLRKNTTLRNSYEKSKTLFYLKTLYATKYKKKPPKITNPLQIPEEDEIFDEMKKYLCYKYETKRSNTYDNTKIKEEQKSSKIKSEFKIKKIKPQLKTADTKRLNFLYLSTNKISNKIYVIKSKKSNNDLITYQKNLLDVVKPSLSDYSYMYLKDRLYDIRKKNSKKYQNNYRRLKEIELEEKDIVDRFNETCEKFIKQFKKVKEEKNILSFYNLDVKLPTMTFISCLKKDKNNKQKNPKKANKGKIKNLKMNKS